MMKLELKAIIKIVFLLVSWFVCFIVIGIPHSTNKEIALVFLSNTFCALSVESWRCIRNGEIKIGVIALFIFSILQIYMIGQVYLGLSFQQVISMPLLILLKSFSTVIMVVVIPVFVGCFIDGLSKTIEDLKNL